MAGGGRRIQKGRLNSGEVVDVSLEHTALDGEIGKFALAGNLDQSRCFQFFNVVGEGCSRHWLFRPDLGTGGAFSRSDLAEDLVAARVRESAGDHDDLPIC